MTGNRRGFSLLELLAILPLMVALAIILDSVFPTLIHDAPAAHRAALREAQLTHMLDLLRTDVDCATSLPAAAAGKTAGDDVLLIEARDGVFCYEKGEGNVTKSRLQNGEFRTLRTVPLTEAVIAWKPVTEDSQPLALQVHTAVLMKIRGGWAERLANNHLFYMHALKGCPVPK